MGNPADLKKRGRGQEALAIVIVWLIAGGLLHIFLLDLSLMGVFSLMVYRTLTFVWLFAIISWIIISRLVPRVPPFKLKNGVIAVLLLVMGSIGLHTLGTKYGLLLRFHLCKPTYVDTVQRLQQKYGNSERQGLFYEDEGDALVDAGPPQRVAIRIPNSGVFDSFWAAVYDPSGAVESPNSDSLTQQGAPFGGKFVQCMHLEDGWYFCFFSGW